MTRYTRVLITRERRIALTEATGVTLDGAPARISGYNNQFATVREVATGKGVEFSWATVSVTVDHRNGEFHS